MTNYLINIYSPAGDPPPPEVLQPIMTKLAELREEMKQAGAWVFSSGLDAPEAATVLYFADGAVLETDGPYTEGKEHLGGFAIVDAPDLDAALGWGAKLTRATGLPIEVRPFGQLG